MSFWNDPSALLPKQAHRWVISFGDHDLSEKTQDGDNAINTFFAKSVDRPSYQTNIVNYLENYTYEIRDPQKITWKPITIVFYDVLERRVQTKESQKIYNKEFDKTKQNIPYPHGKDIHVNDTIVNITNPTKVGTTKNQQDKKEADVLRSTQMFFYKLLGEAGYNKHINLAKNEAKFGFRPAIPRQDVIKSLVGNDKFLYIKELSDANNAGSAEIKFKEIWKLYNPIIDNVSFDKLDYSSEEILKITVTLVYDWASLESNSYADSLSVYPESIISQEKKLTATIIPAKPKVAVVRNKVGQKIDALNAQIKILKQKPAVQEALIRSDTGTPNPAPSGVQTPEASELLLRLNPNLT